MKTARAGIPAGGVVRLGGRGKQNPQEAHLHLAWNPRLGWRRRGGGQAVVLLAVVLLDEQDQRTARRTSPIAVPTSCAGEDVGEAEA